MPTTPGARARSVTLIADGPVSVEPNDVSIGTASPTVSRPSRSYSSRTCGESAAPA